jgi:ABC-2 type transport system permease protein
MSTQSTVFLTLLKREIWEHRGAFVYTPLIIGAVLFLFALMGTGSAAFWGIKIDGASLMAEGAVKMAQAQAKPEQLQIAANAFFFGTALLWQTVLSIVLFFYCIGCLYDERRDRSVLFWKSMPVSDLETVLSKVVTASLVAPLITLAAMIIGQIVLALYAGLMIAIYGGSPWALWWGNLRPFSFWGSYLGVIGVQVLWLLPLVGWLMLAGSFARSKPFLWAVLPPVALSILESYLRFTADFSMSRIIWEAILSRAAAAVAPVSYKADVGEGQVSAGLSGTDFAAGFSDVYARLGSLDLWIGVVVGLAFLAGAVFLRRYRDDSTN